MTRLILLAVLLSLALVGTGQAVAGGGEMYVVNMTGDQTDFSTADVRCDIDNDPNNGDQCTLRAAIHQATNTLPPDTIHFNISPGGAQTITPMTPLPIVQFITIDGTTQPDCGTYPCIVIDGSGVNTPGADGLELQTSNNTVRGLVINQFPDAGIELVDGVSNNVIAGNYIGTDLTGMMDLGNHNGIKVVGSNNVIGGPDPDDRNVIAGHDAIGVMIESEASSQNVVTNNYIGVTADGETALGGTIGVFVRDEPTSGRSRIGATGSSDDNIIGPGNVISGNSQGPGVHVWSSGTVVVGNRIGTDASGQSAVPNGEDGVLLHGDGNRIGGISAPERNIISGNTGHGVSIMPYDLSTAVGNAVLGNYIGTNASGTADLGNGGEGISLQDAESSTIGIPVDADDPAGNLVSGNGSNGIGIHGSSSDIFVGFNMIGTNASGEGGIGNGGSGVFAGGPVTESSIRNNVISGNAITGVHLAFQTEGIEVTANRIGVTPSDDPLGNGGHGVFIRDSSDHQIGVTLDDTPEDGNIIAYNGGNGVMVTTDGHSATGNTIRYNEIYSNDLKGIDTAAGGNNELAPPVITGPLRSGIDEGIGGTACPNCIVDVYSDDEDEGRIYEGTATAEGNGSWSLGGPFIGPFLTATNTNDGGNTSEFSTAVIAPEPATPTPEPTSTQSPTATPVPSATPGPSETPGPTASPSGSETPAPKSIQGDTDCDEDADSVDALFVLRDVAGFEPSKCIDQGDVDCDEDRDSVDALGILRHVAALPPLVQQEPCMDIGDPL